MTLARYIREVCGVSVACWARRHGFSARTVRAHLRWAAGDRGPHARQPSVEDLAAYYAASHGAVAGLDDWIALPVLPGVSIPVGTGRAVPRETAPEPPLLLYRMAGLG